MRIKEAAGFMRKNNWNMMINLNKKFKLESETKIK
jgi:hypothetical protein